MLLGRMLDGKLKKTMDRREKASKRIIAAKNEDEKKQLKALQSKTENNI